MESVYQKMPSLEKRNIFLHSDLEKHFAGTFRQQNCFSKLSNHIFILHLLEPVVKAEESIPTEAVVEEVVAKADEPKVEVVEEVVAKPEEPIVEAKAEGTLMTE